MWCALQQKEKKKKASVSAEMTAVLMNVSLGFVHSVCVCDSRGDVMLTVSEPAFVSLPDAFVTLSLRRNKMGHQGMEI